jgi:hypothetical protein
MAASTTPSDCEIDFRSRYPRELSMAEHSTAVWIAECNGLTARRYVKESRPEGVARGTRSETM